MGRRSGRGAPGHQRHRAFGRGHGSGSRFLLGLGGITGHRDFARGTGRLVRPEAVVSLCDAILRVFVTEGDRTDRRKARLKYVLDRLGVEAFVGLVERRLGAPLERAADAAIRPAPPPLKHGHVGVHPQKQQGPFYAGVATPVGRLTVERLLGLAELSPRFGSGTIRLTVCQNLLISDVAEAALPRFREELAGLGLSHGASAIRGGLVVCTGNSGCKFTAANTKRHAAQLADFLESRLALDQPINIHLTGCHHCCAEHYVGDIGLFAPRVERGDETVEGYDLHVGGGAGPEQGPGRPILRGIPAEQVGSHVLALLRAWLATRSPNETFRDFCARHGTDALATFAGARTEEPA